MDLFDQLHLLAIDKYWGCCCGALQCWDMSGGPAEAVRHCKVTAFSGQ